jgi:membrane-associated phospholipid phosphatase
MKKKLQMRLRVIMSVLTHKGRYDKLIIFVPILYIIAVSTYMIYHRAWFSPDQFFVFAMIAVVLIGRIKQFLGDWVPVLLFLFGYEYLRGLVPFLTKSAHVLPMIVADNMIFGFIPTIKFQTMFFNTNHLQWYDYASVVLYTSHFIVPMFIAFVFWLHDRKHFKKYTTTFLVLSYLAFLTFVIFPAVPPWMASNQGYLPPLSKIMDQVYGSFAHPISVPSIYQFFGVDLVAAFPSLHAAYPWLIFLFIREKSKMWSYVSLLYVFGVWFAVIYLGEHYFVDVVAGVIYSTVAYLLVRRYDAYMTRRLIITSDTYQKKQLIVPLPD